MTWLIKRGQRDDSRNYLGYHDSTGNERTRSIHGVTSMPEPKTQQTEDVGRIAKWLDPFPVSEIATTCGPLMESWAALLQNRNSRNDVNAYRKYLQPRFKDVSSEEAQKLSTVLTWLDEIKRVRTV